MIVTTVYRWITDKAFSKKNEKYCKAEMSLGVKYVGSFCILSFIKGDVRDPWDIRRRENEGRHRVQ